MSTPPADAEDIVEQLLNLHNAARGCEFDLLPKDGPIARMVFFMHLHGDRIADEIAALRAREAELQKKLDAAVKALEPFALMSSEGVIGSRATKGHVEIITCAEYFHDADNALASIRGEG